MEGASISPAAAAMKENNRIIPVEGSQQAPPAGAPPAGAPPADAPPADAPPAGTPPAGTPPADAPPAGAPPADTPPAGISIDDAAVKKYLKEKYGAEVEDLEAIAKPVEKPLTDEEKRAQEEKIKEDAIKFAITKNKFSAKDFEQFSKESQRKPEDVVFDIMKAKWSKDDPTLSEQDMKDRYEDYFKLNEAEDSWGRKARYPELLNIANNYFEQKYPSIVDAQTEYLTHLENIQDAEVYKKRVDRVFGEYKPVETFELEVPVEGDGTKTEKKTYSFSFSQEAIDEVKTSLLDEASFDSMRGAKEDGIRKTAELALIRKELNKLVTAVAREHGNEVALRSKAGRKGIPPEQAPGAGGGSQNINLPPSSGAAAAMLREERRKI